MYNINTNNKLNDLILIFNKLIFIFVILILNGKNTSYTKNIFTKMNIYFIIGNYKYNI